MPLALVLMAFGMYISGKYSLALGSVIFLIGLVMFLVLWRRKNTPDE
ncbi:MAG TPA: hypothetical protein VMJ64_10475 [Anaerolineales bacterium]|nr:hypothetical protein [Anaerolineales bacterium]